MKTLIYAVLLSAIFVTNGYSQAVSAYSVGAGQPAVGSTTALPTADIFLIRDSLAGGSPAVNTRTNSAAHNIDGFTRGRVIQSSDYLAGTLPLSIRFSVTSASGGLSGSAVAVEAPGAQADSDIFESFVTFDGGIVNGGGTNFQFHDGDGDSAFQRPPLMLDETNSTSAAGVDGFDRREIGRPFGPKVYFTVDFPTTNTAAYQSVPTTSDPAPPSQADIYIAPAGNGFSSIPRRFASASQLGLVVNGVSGDNINALEVIDRGEIGKFDSADIILFSLSTGSPTLGGPAVGNPQNASAADIFIVTAGRPPTVFATSTQLGLTRSSNVNALMVTPTVTP